MVIQGSVPMLCTVNELVEFYECHEMTETGINPNSNTETESKLAIKQSSSAILRVKLFAEASNNKSKSTASSEKFCELHQVHGHSTGKCKAVLAQVQCMRGLWEAAHSPLQTCLQNKFVKQQSIKLAVKKQKETVMTLV